jgi:hypothetical protein
MRFSESGMHEGAFLWGSPQLGWESISQFAGSSIAKRVELQFISFLSNPSAATSLGESTLLPGADTSNAVAS